VALPVQLVAPLLIGEAAVDGPFALFLHDEFGRMVAVNLAASHLTGYSRDELLALGAAALNLDPVEGDRLMTSMHQGRIEGGRTSIRRRDGSVAEVEFRGGRTRAGGLPFLLVAAWEA
jgi:PAS domain S-box-containing protein